MNLRKNDSLIVEILRWLASKATPKMVRAKDISIQGYSTDDVAYHLILMDEYGLLNCERSKSETSDRVIAVYPFLLSARGQDWLVSVESGANQLPLQFGFIDWSRGPQLA